MTIQLYEGITDPFSPFFSIIICTFNRAHLLPRAIDSVIAQTESSWEVIIVDDGSTDDTYSVIRPYLAQWPNIRYVAHRNRGLAISRNVGMVAAIGEYVTFLDSDDWYATDHLASRRQLLEENPGVELIHGGCEVIGDPFVPDKYNVERMIDVRTVILGGTFVIQRTYAVQAGGFPAWSPYSDDGDFFEGVEKRGAKIIRTEHPSYIYDRTTPDSICSIVADGGVEAYAEFRKKGYWDGPHTNSETTTAE